MHILTGFGVERRNVALRTLCLALEEAIAARCCLRIVASRGRRWSGNGELIELKGRELGRDQVPITSHVSQTRSRGDRKLHGIVEARIEKRSLAVHFQIGYKRVPISDGSPPRRGMKIHSGQAESRRKQGGRRPAIWLEGFSIQE